jgi:hypothetical protein
MHQLSELSVIGCIIYNLILLDYAMSAVFVGNKYFLLFTVTVTVTDFDTVPYIPNPSRDDDWGDHALIKKKINFPHI